MQQTSVVFSCLFERTKIQIPVNKYECPQRLSFSPGNLFWGSFTNHNSRNYLHHGINITTNQRLSLTFRGNRNTIIVGDSQTSPFPIFPEGGGRSVHRLQQCTWYLPVFFFLNKNLFNRQIDTCKDQWLTFYLQKAQDWDYFWEILQISFHWIIKTDFIILSSW